MDLDDGSQFGNIPTRPMRVKVLYTFDLESKTNCLARFPNTLDIPAVAIDDQSQVGVIELAQCIDAVIAASPEIVSKLDSGDYTIYAYDYSEYETPLVGQGRLSALLAGSTGGHGMTPKNKSMITGRVCKNLPALFSNGVKETLEVKLRLTPVAQVLRKEFSKMDEGVRGLSPATSAGFDPNAWNASIHHHPSSDNFAFDPMSTTGDAGALLEDIFGLGADYGLGTNGPQNVVTGIPETPTNNSFVANPASTGASHSAPGSRSGSPMLREVPQHQSFSGRMFDPSEQSRCSSRASARSDLDAPYHHRQASVQSQPALAESQFDDYYGEDNQSRKRAKVMQTDWHGRSSFGARSSDLRVTAATASSMHMIRPIARRAFGSTSSLDPPPRVPTPVPQRIRRVQHDAPPLANPRSMLRQASTIDSDLMSDADPMSDAMISSPEGSSPGESIMAEGTPMDFPSSPPIVPRRRLLQPSSPRLPTLPKAHMADSGYMSEPTMHSEDAGQRFAQGDSQSPFAEDAFAIAQNESQTRRRDTSIKSEGSMTRSVSPRLMDVPPSGEMMIQMDNIQMERPGDMNRLPRSVLLNVPSARRGLSQGSDITQAASSPAPTMPAVVAPPAVPLSRPNPQSVQPQSRRGSLALPYKPSGCTPTTETSAIVPEKQIRRPLQRCRTNVTDSDAGSPYNSDNESRPRGAVRSGSAAPRRKVIERRLQESLAKGEMPEFCSHCGAIETPTWRKLYVKHVDGQNTALDAAEGEGEIIGVQTLEKNPDTGKVTKFVIRKMLGKAKDAQPGPGFVTAVVCNPCGLWFKKTKQMRPSDRWGKSSRRRKRQRSGDDATDGMEPDSEAFFTDQLGPEDSAEASNSDEQPPLRDSSPSRRMQVRRVRSNSMLAASSRQINAEVVLPAQVDTRAIQSSPIRFRGSQETPIELDLTPKPTRRLLFPSPRQAGVPKNLENGESPLRKSTSPDANGQKRRVTPSKAAPGNTDNDVTIFGAVAFEKENIAPLDETDELAYLFESPTEALFRTPQRKSTTKKAPFGIIPKTPTMSTQKRSVLSPNVNAVNGAQGVVDGCMLSPSSSRYFLRSTPSRLERTPGGRSGQHGTAQEMTPFTRHLADMLNDGAAIQEAAFTSPSRQFDFTDLPTFSTPGREMNWKDFDDMLSSEFVPVDEHGGSAHGLDGGAI